MSAVMSHQTIAYWNKGKRLTERGWTFDGTPIALSELSNARSFAALQEMGVPVYICEECKMAGYHPSEISSYLKEHCYDK
jgi:hypothetical protein